jgi:hypothetical protein
MLRILAGRMFVVLGTDLGVAQVGQDRSGFKIKNKDHLNLGLNSVLMRLQLHNVLPISDTICKFCNADTGDAKPSQKAVIFSQLRYISCPHFPRVKYNTHFTSTRNHSTTCRETVDHVSSQVRVAHNILDRRYKC